MCKALRSKEISDLIDSGAKTVEALGLSCGAGTDCGSCVNRLQRLLESQVKKNEAEVIAVDDVIDTREAG